MRRTTTAVLVAMALCGAATAARAQDAGKTDVAANDAAEDAFLKAYFQEKELKSIAVAERMYAAIVEQNPPAREVVARSLLGRARCLRFQKHVEEAAALFARVEKEFADVADAAKEAQDARRSAAATTEGTLEARVRASLDGSGWFEEAQKYGERGVPTLAALLNRDDDPERVRRAAVAMSQMDSGAAADALAKSIEERSSTYPEQVRAAVTAGYASAACLRRLAELQDAGIRTAALTRLAFEFGDAAAIDKALGDATLRTNLIASKDGTAEVGRVLVAALAHGGEARDAALARLRAEEFPQLVADGIAKTVPPPSLVQDAEALAALARHVGRPNDPSPELVAAFLRHPETAAPGVLLTLLMRRASADPAAFADAVARVGFGKPSANGPWGADQLAEALVAALGPSPSPDVLHRLAAAWPEYRDWNVEGPRLPAFLARLIASGVDDERSLRAFQDGLAATPGEHHVAFVEALRAMRHSGRPAGDWVADAFLYELTLPTGFSAHDAAAAGLDEWQAARGGAAGLSTKVPQIVAALGTGGTDHLTTVLGRIGPSSIDALKAALPTHPRKAYVVRALVVLGDKSSADAIERVVAELSDIADEEQRKDALQSAVTSLVEVCGDAALDTLSAAIGAHDGRAAVNVLESVGELPDNGVAFGDGPRFALCKLALEKAPRALSGWPGVADRLPKDRRRELAVLAMKSADPQDRLWGVNMETKLLDADAWDALLVAAQDPDDDIRDCARDALRAIRAKEMELAEFRAMGEERETRKRIETLLRLGTDERRAGIAAIAATGMAGMVNDLIRLAAEDKDPNVREDARRALLAMAKPAAPATQPPAEKK